MPLRINEYHLVHRGKRRNHEVYGNVEIRAVANSDEYKNDDAIKGMLSAFKLKDIETL